MPVPRRFQDIDASGCREPNGAFTAAAARLKSARITAYAAAYEAQRSIPYDDTEPYDDEPEGCR